jgi:hypothetical protein
MILVPRQSWWREELLYWIHREAETVFMSFKVRALLKETTHIDWIYL